MLLPVGEYLHETAILPHSLCTTQMLLAGAQIFPDEVLDCIDPRRVSNGVIRHQDLS